MYEDLDEATPATPKRAGKVKSPMKANPIQWPIPELDSMRQNRYAVDRPEMRDYY